MVLFFMTSNTSNTFEKNEILSNVLIVSPIFNIEDGKTFRYIF